MSNEVLEVKFEGNALRNRSLPVYELGTSLIALQRIVYKAALFSAGKLEKGSTLPARSREQVALQVTRHGRGSDLWGLAPYLSDPALGPIFQGLIVAGLAALGAYTWKKVVPAKGQIPTNQVLIVNVFPEIKQLSDRIGNIGDVDRIQIQAPSLEAAPKISITAETQEYVRKLEYELVPGKKSIISGLITRLHPQSSRLDVEDVPGHYIHVTMDAQLFEKIRRLRHLTEREIRLEGIPLYKLGASTGIHEFRASRLIIPRRK